MRIFAKSTVLLLTLLLLVQFCACTNQADTENNDNSVQISDNSASSESTDMSKISELPEKNWDGREFRVLGYENSYTQFSTFEIDTDGETGEVVNDAVYRRNLAIEEKYNVEITEYKDTEPVYGNATAPFIRQFVLAQEDEFDLVFANANCIGALAREGLFADLKEIDYIDFSKDWWNKEVNDSLSIMNKQYFASSNFSLRDKSRAYIMLYNRALADDYDLGNPVDYVHNGTWTFDVMSQWARIAAQDLNGNGTVDDSDTFGIVMDSYQSTQALTSGFGIRVIGKDENDIPQFTLGDERSVTVYDKIKGFIYNNESIYIGDAYDIIDMFANNQALFFPEVMYHVKTMRDRELNFGVLPCPKYDESQELYIQSTDSWCLSPVCVPITTPNADRTSFILQLMAEKSYEMVTPAYYDVCLQGKYISDEESADMMDIIFGAWRVDNMEIFNWGNFEPAFRNAIIKNGDLASLVEKNRKSTEKAMENTISALTGKE